MPQLSTAPPSPVEAARFLNQATFGATHASINDVVSMGYSAWIDWQMALPMTSHRKYYQVNLSKNGGNAKTTRQNGWWEIATTAPDQLRQRVAFTLAEILVVSELNTELDRANEGFSAYYDILVANAFRPYRNLLGNITLSPVMGRYLSMLGSPKPNPAQGLRADENFAREVMQLFSVGLVQLNLDGTPTLDVNGNTIPTYGQPEVENLARAFTGWSFNGATSLNPRQGNFVTPMVVYRKLAGGPGDFHDTDPKTILGGAALAPGQTAEQDLARALDVIAAHPNVAPFISRQLIQRLVTSNPTPGYVARVATVFRSSRGNLGPVVKALLLDPEARLGPSYLGEQFGKVREPVLVVTHMWRAFKGAPSGNGGVTVFKVNAPEASLSQAAYRSPSVFNFFQPSYTAPFAIRGITVSSGCTVAPELQLVDESSEPALSAYLSESSRRFDGPTGVSTDYSHNVRLHFDDELPLVNQSTEALLDDLNLLLMSGQMTPDYYSALKNYVEADIVVSDSPALRVAKAIYMIMSSPQYRVQR